MFDILKTFKCNLFKMKQKYVGGGRGNWCTLHFILSLEHQLYFWCNSHEIPTYCMYKNGMFPLTHKVNCIINHLL